MDSVALLKNANFKLLVLGYLIFFAGIGRAQVQLGQGSYSVSGNFTVPPSSPYVTESFSQKVISNKWWSTLITNQYSEPFFAHPCSYRAISGGLEMGYPGESQGRGASFDARHVGDLVLGVSGLSASDTRVASYSHFAVTARWEGSNRGMEATMGQGLPFVYLSHLQGMAQITFGNAPTVWSDQGNVLGVTVNGRNYGIFAPSGSIWSGTNTITSTLGGKNYFSVTVLPDNTLETLAYFKNYAYSFVTDTKVSWTYQATSASLVTVFEATTEAKEGSGSETLFALMRHHWINTSVDMTPYVYKSARGEMKVRAGNSFHTVSVFNGALPALPTSGVDLNVLGSLVRSENIPTIRGNTYNKNLGKIAQLAQIAHMSGETGKRDEIVSKLKESLEQWFTSGGAVQFYYHAPWNRLVGYPAAYGSDTRLSDHHFHYGYFLKAAAIVAQWDPDWARPENWGGMVSLLVRDVNTWDENDSLFGRFAYFEPYEGHGWADGMGFATGNNQESSSESMNFNSALILWGAMTGNTQLRDMGIFMYVNETASIEQYWWDVDDETFPIGYDHATVGILWSNGGSYSTWFSSDPGHIHGINFLPITAGHLYLGRQPDFIPINYAEGFTGTWSDLFYEYLAFSDAAAALENYNGGANIEGGNTRAALYLHIHSLASGGRLNTKIVGDIPTFAVFDKGNVRTYTAYNPETKPKEVAFNDGFLMTVPPNEQVSETGPVIPPLGVEDPTFRFRSSKGFSVKFIPHSNWAPQIPQGAYRKWEIFDTKGVKLEEALGSPSGEDVNRIKNLKQGMYILKVFQ